MPGGPGGRLAPESSWRQSPKRPAQEAAAELAAPSEQQLTRAQGNGRSSCTFGPSGTCEGLGWGLSRARGGAWQMHFGEIISEGKPPQSQKQEGAGVGAASCPGGKAICSENHFPLCRPAATRAET